MWKGAREHAVITQRRDVGTQHRWLLWLVPAVAVALVALLLGARARVARQSTSPRSTDSAPASIERETRPVAPASHDQVAIAGRAQTPEATAIVGVRVCASPAAPDCCGPLLCTLSDAAGRFVLDVPALTDARPWTLFLSHPGHLPETRSVQIPFRGPPLIVTLRQGGARVTGTVLDASGGPIAGAQLRATDGNEQPLALSTADAAGEFSLSVVEGGVLVVAEADGYSREMRTVRAPLGGLKIVLAPVASLVGRVLVEGTREPIAGARVRATGDDPRHLEREVFSGPDGAFSLDERHI